MKRAGPQAASGGARPTSAGAQAASGRARPTSAGAQAASGRARPTSSGAQAASGGARPTSAGAQAASGGARPTSSGAQAAEVALFPRAGNLAPEDCPSPSPSPSPARATPSTARTPTKSPGYWAQQSKCRLHTSPGLLHAWLHDSPPDRGLPDARPPSRRRCPPAWPSRSVHADSGHAQRGARALVAGKLCRTARS